MKKINLIIVAIILCFTTYGFVHKFNTSQKSTQQANIPEQEILGSWALENDSTNKIEFLADGTVNSYESNVLKYTYTYSISNECGGSTSTDNSHFLKTIDGEDGTISCDIINGIDNSPGGFLSLTTDNGKLIIYVRS